LLERVTILLYSLGTGWLIHSGHRELVGESVARARRKRVAAVFLWLYCDAVVGCRSPR